MAKTYTVKWGDTLWDIAKENNTTYQTLAKINGLDIIKKNGKDYVHLAVGQVIKLVDDGSSSSSAQVTGSKVKIKTFGLQSNSDRGMYVTWQWDRANTKEYKIEWYDYYDEYWHKHESTVTVKNSEFTANNEATKVKVKIKPVAKTYKNSKDKEVAYWTNVSWVTSSTYSFSSNPSKKPNNAPSISIEGTKLTTSLESASNFTELNSPSIIEFQLMKDNAPTSTRTKVSVGSKVKVTAEFNVKIGSSYRVRARTVKGAQSSAWSDWSVEVATQPAAPDITKCTPGTSENTIDIAWTSVNTADSYEIQYATDQSRFDNPLDNEPYTVSIGKDDARANSCIATIDPEGGIGEKKFYFRIRAINTENSESTQKSAWSNISQFNSEDGPAAPTTFSSRSMITVGETVTLNWTHNSENENNYPKYSHVDLYVDGVKKLIPTISHDGETTNEKSYTISTKTESSGEDDDIYELVCTGDTILQWRVRTAGDNDFLGDWSVLRTINVYMDPQLTFYAMDADGNPLESPSTLNKLPLKLKGLIEGTTNQKIIGYHISITADKNHQTTNNFGETVMVFAGDTVYARPFDVVNSDTPNEFDVDISAGDVTFTNDVSYTVTCTVTMDSGISVSKSISFAAVLTTVEYLLDAEISVDPDYYTASIRPYCLNPTTNTPVDNVLLHVYRREYDGSFTYISGDINNTSMAENDGELHSLGLSNTFVTDPHPALDYARYRIVAVDNDSGTTVYSDLPPYPVGCKSIIVQWGESWVDFDEGEDTGDEEFRAWSGEMLKLPYNIDITPHYAPDVALVKYIGREHPVDYYGTQRGESAIWNAVIDRKDQETIYALHRLSRHMGNVYVREPSGIGYRAHVTVSFPRKHRDVTIPVSLDVTRVEEGE